MNTRTIWLKGARKESTQITSEKRLFPSYLIMKSLGSDLVSFAFDSQAKINRRTPLYTDAECPSRSLNATQTRTLVRKLIAGFKTSGLRRGDRVLVHLFNNVRPGFHPPRSHSASGPRSTPILPRAQLTDQ
jgi:hypothetical protein